MTEQEYSPIALLGDHIVIRNLEIHCEDGVEYLQRFPPSEHESICLDALELGFICLQTVQARHSNEFVRRQMDTLLMTFETSVTRIAEAYEEELIAKIGTDNGQLLAPLKAQINQTAAILTAQVEGVRTLLNQDIDPRNETTVLGSALRSLALLLDPKRSDSLQGSFNAALATVTEENGAIAQSVKAVVAEAVKPLAAELDKLRQEVRDKQIAHDALQITPAKGIPYEEAVVAQLQAWAKFSGIQVTHVGHERTAGDILVRLTPQSFAATDLTIVIEIKNITSNPLGRIKIERYLAKAMERREAQAAIFLSREPQGLAQEIGDWAEGTCPQGFWIATTQPFLTFAIRFLALLYRLNTMRSSHPDLDATVIAEQLIQIRTALGRIATIKRHVTDLGKNTEAIRIQADALRQEINDALLGIEQVLSRATSL
jgi:regulator of replication initiation timing